MIKNIIKLLNINQYPYYIKKFIFISYIFSFILWIVAFIFIGNEKLLLGDQILDWQENTSVLLFSMVALLAGFGPFIAYLSVKKEAKYIKKIKFINFNSALKIFVLFMFATLFISLFGFLDIKLHLLNIDYAIIILFFYIFISGAEEFGWRGILFPYISQKAKTLDEASIVLAIIWGFWHLPVMIIMFMYEGFDIVGIFFMFLLFLLGLYLISYIHGWLNLRTKSILPNILLHGILFW